MDQCSVELNCEVDRNVKKISKILEKDFATTVQFLDLIYAAFSEISGIS